MSKIREPKDIFLFQDEKEVRHARSLFFENDSSFLAVPWQASAVDGLNSSDIKYTHFLKDSDKKLGSEEFYRRKLSYREWNICIDSIISKHCDEVSSLNFSPFLHQMFANRNLFNIFFNDIEKFYQLWKYYPESIFHIYHYRKKEFSTLSRIYELLIKQSPWDIKFEVHKPNWEIGGTMVPQEIYPDWVGEMDLFNKSKSYILFTPKIWNTWLRLPYICFFYIR